MMCPANFDSHSNDQIDCCPNDHERSVADPKSCQPPEVQTVDAPPDGGVDAWCVFAGVLLSNFVVWGGNMALAFYLSSYITSPNSPVKDSPKSVVSLLNATSLSAMLFVSPLSNILERHIGIRSSMAVGALMCTIGLFMASLSSNTYWLITWQAIFTGMGRGFIATPGSYILARWFDKKCSLVTGLCHSGAGLGSVTWYWISYFSVDKYGLNMSFHLNNIISTVLIIPAIILTKDRLPARGTHARRPVEKKPIKGFSFAPLKNKIVLALVIRGFFIQWAHLVCRNTFTTYTIDALGLSSSRGLYIQIITSIGLTLGRPIMGNFADRIDAFKAATIIDTVNLLTHLFLWLPASNFAVMGVFSFFYSFTGGSFFLITLSMVAKVASAEELGDSMTMMWMVTGISSLLSTPVSFHIIESLLLRGSVILNAYRSIVVLNSVCVFIGILISVYIYMFYSKSKKLAPKAESSKAADLSEVFITCIRLSQ